MFKRTFQAFALLAVLALLLAACSPMSSSAPDGYEAEIPPAAPGGEQEAPSEDGALGGRWGDSSQTGQVDRIVIKNANLTIAVDAPEASMNNISRMAEEMGGYVVSANSYYRTLSSGVEVPQASLTIRVPAERLNEALERIRAEASQPVIRETVDSQDVTREYTDLRSRLRNLEAAEAQLQEIMDEARQTEDVLAVYNELVRVREQIEVIQGQINYYEQASALSAISVELMANEAVQPLTIGSWQPAGVARDAVQALINALQFFATAGLWVILFFVPVLLLILVPLYLLFRIARRVMRRRPTAPAPPPPAS